MRKGRALPIAPAALQLRKGHVQKHWYMYLHKHIYTNIWKYKCACTSPGVHKAFLWKGAAEIHPLNLWALLEKPSEAEAEGGERGAFLFEVNGEGKQNKKKSRQGGWPGRLPLQTLLRKAQERLKQSCVSEVWRMETFSKKGDDLKKSSFRVIRKNACCPTGPPNAPRREAKRFPPPSRPLPPSIPRPKPRPSGGGRRTGHAHRYKFRLTHDNKRPPSLRRALGSTRGAQDPAQAGGWQRCQ